MVCLYCRGKTQVVNSRHQKRLNQTWRRRKCSSCSNIFSTTEKINYSTTLLITNKTGTISDFSKDKLLLSVYRSLGHRDDAINDAVALTDTIMSSIIKPLATPLVDTASIVKTTYLVLSNFDKAAAVHYRAYYPLSKD
jgi:transcriptional regulator NrdR family protein